MKPTPVLPPLAGPHRRLAPLAGPLLPSVGLGGVLLLVAPLVGLSGCTKVGCLSGADDCEVPSACPALNFTCDGGMSEVRVLNPGDPFPGGMDALASPGDVLLGNDQVVVVIDALDHPHYIAPTGGTILDLSTRGADNDSLRHLFQATGLLPGDSVYYEDQRLIEEGDVKAVQVSGHLVSSEDIRVYTRYEVRPCEPGVRIRTEIVNGTPDTLPWFLTDAWYYGGRENLPFTPGPGSGFDHPSFGLSDIATAFRDTPYLVAAAHVAPAATYAEVACDQPALSGFHAEEISAVGVGPWVVPPRDYMVFERFVAAASGAAVSAGADIALEIRNQLFGEGYTDLSGSVDAVGGTLGETLRASVVISEGTPDMAAERRTPWTEVLPDTNGAWNARVPTNRSYVLDAESFGRVSAQGSVAVGDTPVNAATLITDPVGEVTINATVDGDEDHVLVYVVPADDATDNATRGDMYGHFVECAPLLGNPHGPSPACNRVLVDGETTVALPPGTYDFYAVGGPFTTMAGAQGVVVDGNTGQSVLLSLVTLPDLQPEGALSADFHVHGGASFDSSMPDYDRVRAFLAARIDVVASTEHDVVKDYAEAMAALGAGERMHLITGTESTGHILFKFRDDYSFPEVIGHWMFWPIAYDPEGPWRGSAWDELAEPGLLITHQRDEAGFDPATGVVQLNHPLGGMQFGRDYSWGNAAGFNLLEPLKKTYDGTGQSLYFHKPDGADYDNSAYNVQEVMNGTNNFNFLQYRAFWWYLLDQGIVRAGTANSDSHTLTEGTLGTPRNLVFTSVTLDDFDLTTFDADVRAGHMLGTNGPVILASVVGGDNVVHEPGVEAFTPAGDSVLSLQVRAAPWVPVDEVRVIVNGQVRKTLTNELTQPQDSFGMAGLDRLDIDIPLADLVSTNGDSWIVVEAGVALEPNEDLNCDGIPDTGDNNRDGIVDWHDVEELESDPSEECFDVVGPLTDPAPPDRGTPRWYFAQVTPENGYPLAFTNPFLLDRDGNGYSGAGQ